MMASPIETAIRLKPEETSHSSMSLFFGDEPTTPEWWRIIHEAGLIYPDSGENDPVSASVTEPAIFYGSNHPISLEVLDILRAIFRSDTALVQELWHWDKRAEREALQQFISREAANLDCVIAIKADCREDALDLLFVVKGDLFEGEKAVLPLMRRLRSNFRDILFDVMVLPASRYTQDYKWGPSPSTLLERKIRHE